MQTKTSDYRQTVLHDCTGIKMLNEWFGIRPILFDLRWMYGIVSLLLLLLSSVRHHWFTNLQSWDPLLRAPAPHHQAHLSLLTSLITPSIYSTVVISIRHFCLYFYVKTHSLFLYCYVVIYMKIPSCCNCFLTPCVSVTGSLNIVILWILS
jgi:hypothetical protein